jgi:predicted ATPase
LSPTLGDNRRVSGANDVSGGPRPGGAEEIASAAGVARLRRVQIVNYKSISKATVDLGRLTILVGPNGAGKSNFLDALSFVRDCLANSVELAFKNRGGISAVRRRSGGHPTHIGIRLIVDLPNHQAADYAFEVAAEQGERFSIARERCTVRDFMGDSHGFRVDQGRFQEEIPGVRAQVARDRLALFAASATEEFRPLYDFLTAMSFYSIVPSELRKLQPPDVGDVLKRDGSNAAAVLKRIEDESPDGYRRICSLLSTAVPGISGAAHLSVGQFETVQFRQDVGLKHPWTFAALNVSDGTLRMLGLLLAVYQLGPATVLGIEEPEATVHPAVTEQIVEVLRDASRLRQVVITTHSPDLLDLREIDDEDVRVVTNPRNATTIAPLADTSRRAVRENLYTTGELLRVGELEGDTDAAESLANQLNLFGPPAVSSASRS